MRRPISRARAAMLSNRRPRGASEGAAALGRAPTLARAAGLVAMAAAAACLALAPLIGEALFADIWGVEPLTYIGAALLIAGLSAVALSYALPNALSRRARNGEQPRDMSDWSSVTQQYFELFDHDLGRPLRRILGKERELRAYLRAAEREDGDEIAELLDEIEMQAPNFRLMMSNIRVLIQLEAPDASLTPQPVEVSAVVRRIVDRYNPVAKDTNKSITWWAEPSEFGIVYSDSAAIEHIVTNLVDNAIRFAESQVEISLSRDAARFFVQVWDDGPGVPAHYRGLIFERGWTPAVARGDEKTSSGLGLHIASALAARYGGDLSIKTGNAPDDQGGFVLSLPLNADAAAEWEADEQ